MDSILQRLTDEFKIQANYAENVVKLIDDGNTIPFIARYRKELTGEMDDQVLRAFCERLEYLRALAAKKEEVIRHISEQGKLTEEISKAVENAKTVTEVDDIYRPFRPKRRTRATIAKEKGLSPLADILLAQKKNERGILEIAADYINPEKEVNTAEEALASACDILAETFSDNAEFRKNIRFLTEKNGILEAKAAKEGESSVYEMYYDFKEPCQKIQNHRVLAIDRGEKEGFLTAKLTVDEEIPLRYLTSKVLAKEACDAAVYVAQAAEDSYRRLIAPSIEREIRNLLTERAQEAAIRLFSENLKNLLLQPPIKDNIVLGVDPGYRTGCKLAVVSETGRVLETGVGYFTLDHHDKEKAKKQIKGMIERHGVTLVSIGNGTASAESQIFIADLLKELSRTVYYVMTNEAGASVYSASKLGADEFPDYDVALRSAVSIARRVQDPLAELVKIDPKSIGVGQYQHDMNQKKLASALGGVVEDCVNSVGVNLNTASAPLLSYIAGINQTVAKNIVAYREENGKFTSRRQLTKVAKLGEKAFLQCAGFLRIPDGKNLLDNTSVHPESYEATEKILSICGFSMEDAARGKISDIKDRVKQADLTPVYEQYQIGRPTVIDICDALLKKGRDMREELPKPVLLTDVLSLEDLKPGMVLTGTVRNVIDFGAFVDIGVHQDGLVHISQISNKFIKHPMEVLSVGDVVKVKVLDVDVNKKRISLSMKDC